MRIFNPGISLYPTNITHKSHKNFSHKSHKNFSHKSHKSYPCKSHKSYPCKSHKSYPCKSHKSYPCKSHKSFSCKSNKVPLQISNSPTQIPLTNSTNSPTNSTFPHPAKKPPKIRIILLKSVR